MDICALGLVGRGCETIGDAEGPEGGMERDWETCQEGRLAGEYMIKEKKRTNRDMGAGRDGAGKDGPSVINLVWHMVYTMRNIWVQHQAAPDKVSRSRFPGIIASINYGGDSSREEGEKTYTC